MDMDVDTPPVQDTANVPTPLPSHILSEPPQTAVPPRPMPPPAPEHSQQPFPVSTQDDTGSASINPSASNPGVRSPVPPASQTWPATALPSTGPPTPAPPPTNEKTDRSPSLQVQPAPPAIPQETTPHPGTPSTTGIGLDPSEASSPPGSLRPLNVKDALSYLEMVKVKFQDKAEVYNQFLDIMKDFKSQAIDTPGVIARVSTLFRGHPSLIQGFNTFLPQGYRIDCSMDAEDNTNLITVTTPTGTHTQTSDGVIRRTTRHNSALTGAGGITPGLGEVAVYFGGVNANNGPYAGPNGFNSNGQAGAPVTPQPMHLGLPPQQLGLSSGPGGIHSPHPTTPGVANFLVSQHHHNSQNNHPGFANPANFEAQARPDQAKNPVEFNHAINYVNKIKNRYANDPDTYKQFLEILQTYQKEQRPIRSVYEQVAVLFGGSVDLLDEFKQFLPDTSQGSPEAMGGLPGGSGGGAGFDSRVGNSLFGAIINAEVPAMAATTTRGGGSVSGDRTRGEKSKDQRGGALPPPPPAPPTSDKMSVVAEKTAASAKNRSKKRAMEKDPPLPPAAAVSHHHHHHHTGTSGSSRAIPPNTAANGLPSKSKKPKHHHHKTDAASPSPPPIVPPTAATDETMFFDRVRRHIDDRTTYNEFLKLLHLFTEEIIDIRVLMERAAGFLGGEGSEMLNVFKEVLRWDERTIVDGELNADGSTVMSATRGTVAVVPTIDRPKVDLNSCRKYGPSYRKLPKHEITLACSGRDAMCWEVLNDEWVSHPTWASEDAGFSTHQKNIFEDAMHKSEEERHEYDFHIEGITRTISILEPINTRIALMESEERAAYKLKPGLGGQGKSIYQRIIKKVYGREHGLEVITALHDTPAIAIPVVLARLKQKEEEWKRAQREWNKVWREVDARNYYKSLDHQGISFKLNDKKAVNPKQLVQNIETRRREMEVERNKSIDPAYARTIPKYHVSLEVTDVGVLQDCVKLVLSFLDRAPPNSSMAADARQIEAFLRGFVPMFFTADEEVFNAAFGNMVGANGSGGPSSGGAGEELVLDSDLDDAMAVDDDVSTSGAGSSNGNKKKRAGADLRRKALKGAAASGKKGSTSGGKKSASTSRRVSPAPPTIDTTQIDNDTEGTKGKVPGIRVQDNVWVRHGPQEDDEAALNGDNSQPKPFAAASRKGTFFANNTYYVLLRNFHLLYSRLHAAKQHANELASASEVQTPDTPTTIGPGQLVHRPVPQAYLVNPLAASLGLADATGPGASRLIASGPNPAHKFYEHTLECCEQLFDGEMDQAMFEDHMRFMFGIRAYHLFTVDKVVGSIIKQVQAVLSDGKNKELLTLLRRERTSATAYTFQEQINARRTAEQIIGLGENVYRFTWLPDRQVVQIQLLAKDDASTDDAESMTERWKQYMASYVLRHQTEGVTAPTTLPFLSRNLLRFKSDVVDEDDVAGEDNAAGESSTPHQHPHGTSANTTTPKARAPNPASPELTPPFKYGSRSGVAIKVCVRTYRMFFESRGEDWFYRKRTTSESVALGKRLEISRAERRARMEGWVEREVLTIPEDTNGPVENRSAKIQMDVEGPVEADEKEKVASDSGVGGDDIVGPSVNGIKLSEDVDMEVPA
ncbi:Transcriptional regulatory protein sin3 [Tulasnella sp. JGI-2019a]|nr:Transcriptional regulatory protein sin3 [Tulasnella sp. JGI-2019a]